MDNKKVIIKETGTIGKGLFAIEDIKKGEIIADWTGGPMYEAKSCMSLPTREISDHAIQCEEHTWIDTEGLGRYSNHSCKPNYGIQGKFKLVAMRDVKKGEWLTWDYEMTEDSDWKMKCKCGTPSCRKLIEAYKNMPKRLKKKYKGHTSEWLVGKYSK